MSEISKITLPSGSTYDIKDAAARQSIADIAAAGLTYSIVSALPTASASTKGTIYLVAHTHGTNNGYDEYLTIEKNSTYYWEKIGSTDMDLTGYAKNGDLVGLGSATAANAKTNISVANHTVTQGSTSSTLYYTKEDVLNPSLLNYISLGNMDLDFSASQAITALGEPSADTFVKSYPGSSKKLATKSITGVNGTATIPNVTGNDTVTIPNVTGNTTVTIPNVTGNTTVTIPNVTGNTEVTATQITSYGSLPSFSASVDNEVLTLSFSAGSIPSGTDVTATNTTLGNALTATNTTLGTALTATKTTLGTALTATKTTLGNAFTNIAKAASSATTVASGQLVDDDTHGGSVLVGLGSPSTGSALTNIGEPTKGGFVTSVDYADTPYIYVPAANANNIKSPVVKAINNATSTGATSVSISGTNSGIAVSAHSVTDNGHTHNVDLTNKTLTVGNVTV